MTRAHALYRALLHCYPAAFRHEYGRQMLLMFDAELADARRAGRWLEQAALWGRTAVDILTIAPREHCHVILQDLRYALRTMADRPGFTVVAVLSLALGIGANTAIFSLWNGVLHASLPGVRAPGQLVMLTNPNAAGMWSGRVTSRTDGPRSWLTYSEFEALRDHADTFSGLMASQANLQSFRIRVDGGGWEEANGRLVSGGFFELLGVGPAIGRLFTTAEDRGDAPYAVLSDSYWQRRFGGRPDVLGKTLTLGHVTLTIIGVAPSNFIGETSAMQPDLWIPLRVQPHVRPGHDWLRDVAPTKVMWLHVFGRLKPGVTHAQAEAQANAIFQAGLETFYGALATGARRAEFLDQRLQLHATPGGASQTRDQFSQSLTALLAAVGVLLLIACANLANLLLARGAARHTEIALRLSLGASRGRIVRQLVTESLTMAAMGGVAALAVAYGLHAALVRMLAESDPEFHMRFALGPLVLVFTVAATVAAGLLFGALPAWQVTRIDAGAMLKEQGRGALGTPGQRRWGRVLVSLQLALSLPLLVGAGLLARTVHNLRHADLGFPAERLLVARINLLDAAEESTRRASVRQELVDAFRRLPGVRDASYSHLGMFSGGNSASTIDVEGYTPSGHNDRGSSLDVVGPSYFSTLGVPIVRGRDITEEDRIDSPLVCVINEAFARQFFDRRDPLGRHVTTAGDDKRTTYQIVGVVGNARTQRLRGDVEPRFFLAAAQRGVVVASPTFLIRTATEAAPVLRAVQTTTERVHPSLAILSAGTIDRTTAPLMAQDRTTAQLAVVFGAVALTLAAIGLYGVLSYGVARRTGEIALRIALGARPGRVVSMILREMAALVAVGLVLGGGLAYAMSRLIDSRLYGVAPRDPVTLAGATLVLLVVALAAAYLPAQRASRLDPMTALRQT